MVALGHLFLHGLSAFMFTTGGIALDACNGDGTCTGEELDKFELEDDQSLLQANMTWYEPTWASHSFEPTWEVSHHTFESLIDDIETLPLGCNWEDSMASTCSNPTGDACYHLGTKEGRAKFFQTPCYGALNKFCGGRRDCVVASACAFGRAKAMSCNMCASWLDGCREVDLNKLPETVVAGIASSISSTLTWTASVDKISLEGRNFIKLRRERSDPVCGCLTCEDAGNQQECETLSNGQCKWEAGGCVDVAAALAGVDTIVSKDASTKHADHMALDNTLTSKNTCDA